LARESIPVQVEQTVSRSRPAFSAIARFRAFIAVLSVEFASSTKPEPQQEKFGNPTSSIPTFLATQRVARSSSLPDSWATQPG
jgi:hypothetical protein